MKLVAVIFPLLAMPLDDSYPFEAVHGFLHSLLSERQIPFVDLRDAYRGMPNERLQAIPGKDPHPSEIAHRVAAEVIEKTLRGLDVLPKAVLPRIELTRRDLKRWLPEGRP